MRFKMDETKTECRKCGIEISFDAANPYDTCDGCAEEGNN